MGVCTKQPERRRGIKDKDSIIRASISLALLFVRTGSSPERKDVVNNLFI